MTKVKLKDAIKDLTTDAAKVRDDASRVRQSADGLAKSSVRWRTDLSSH